MISHGNYFISLFIVVFLVRVNNVSDLIISPKVKVVTANDQNNEGDIIVNFDLENLDQKKFIFYPLAHIALVQILSCQTQ